MGSIASPSGPDNQKKEREDAEKKKKSNNSFTLPRGSDVMGLGKKCTATFRD